MKQLVVNLLKNGFSIAHLYLQKLMHIFTEDNIYEGKKKASRRWFVLYMSNTNIGIINHFNSQTTRHLILSEFGDPFLYYMTYYSNSKPLGHQRGALEVFYRFPARPDLSLKLDFFDSSNWYLCRPRGALQLKLQNIYVSTKRFWVLNVPSRENSNFTELTLGWNRRFMAREVSLCLLILRNPTGEGSSPLTGLAYSFKN